MNDATDQSIFEHDGFLGEMKEAAYRSRRVPRHLRVQQLWDAGDLLFASVRSICGNDDRKLVTATETLPWRCVCQLIIEGLHGVKILGTGWIGGPNTIFTAGHNLLDPSKGQKATKVWVFPGRAGTSAPYGYSLSTDFAVHPSWSTDMESKDDIGVIYVKEPIGKKLGWFGFANYSDSKLAALIVNNAGYAVDKPFATMWSNSGRVSTVDAGTIDYLIDTEGGQSGSPIFIVDQEGKRTVVGIHAYGRCPSNYGVRITADVFRQLKQWTR